MTCHSCSLSEMRCVSLSDSITSYTPNDSRFEQFFASPKFLPRQSSVKRLWQKSFDLFLSSPKYIAADSAINTSATTTNAQIHFRRSPLQRTYCMRRSRLFFVPRSPISLDTIPKKEAWRIKSSVSNSNGYPPVTLLIPFVQAIGITQVAVTASTLSFVIQSLPTYVNLRVRLSSKGGTSQELSQMTCAQSRMSRSIGSTLVGSGSLA